MLLCDGKLSYSISYLNAAASLNRPAHCPLFRFASDKTKWPYRQASAKTKWPYRQASAKTKWPFGQASAKTKWPYRQAHAQ
jgi:hypothetical protein